MRKRISLFLLFFVTVLFGYAMSGCAGQAEKSATEETGASETGVSEDRVTEESEIVISLAGDVMLSRGLQQYLDEFGYAYPYEEVRNLFLEDDFTIANLECPITQYAFSANKEKRFVFKADVENAKALKEAGFDCLNLANNHSMDYLSDGLGETIENLKNNQLSVVGAGMNSAEDTSYTFEKDGLKIGILAYTVFPSEGFFYDAEEPTVSYLSDTNLDVVSEKIKDMEADIKIIYFHWGVEYHPYNSDMQQKYAHMAIDSGADFVVGAHPHVLQNTEEYNGKMIYYSLGNFVFDKQIQEGTDRTMILQLTINRDGITKIQEIPAIIEKGKVNLLNH